MMWSLGYCSVPRNSFHAFTHIRGLCFTKCLPCPVNKVKLKNQQLAFKRCLNMCSLEYNNCTPTMFVKGLQTVGVLRCWKCGNDVSNFQLFCKNCNSLQAPKKSSNFFDILKFDNSYEINVSALTSTYRRLQNVLHPDRYVNSSEEEKRISEEYSSLLNKAYATLTDPLKRAIYMLELRNVFIQEDSIQSPEFLLEIMEKNEELVETEDADNLKTFDKKNKLVLEQLSREVREAFKADDLSKAKEAVIKMKYYTTLSEKIKELKLRMEIVEE